MLQTSSIVLIYLSISLIYLYNYESITVKLATHAGLTFVGSYKKECSRNHESNDVFYEYNIRNNLEYPDNCKRPGGVPGDYETKLEAVQYSSDCELNSKNKIAIIIPHRHREEHLKVITEKMHKILQKQRQVYNIFVVHQEGEDTFNRALLLNIGVHQAHKLGYSCFVAHDVDMYPESERNFYYCDSSKIRHLSARMDKFGYELVYGQVWNRMITIFQNFVSFSVFVEKCEKQPVPILIIRLCRWNNRIYL